MLRTSAKLAAALTTSGRTHGL